MKNLDLLAKARLYLCTAIRDDLMRFVSAAIDGGVDIVQLRDKNANARLLVDWGNRLSGLCVDHDVLFVINDRADIAQAVGCHGLHVGQDDLNVKDCRAVFSSAQRRIVGLSTHRPDQLDAALAQDVDYISAGPVHATPTKPGRPGVGLDYLSYASQHCALPWFVTGNVNPGTIGPMLDRGASRFVVVRYLTEAQKPADVRSRAAKLKSLIA